VQSSAKPGQQWDRKAKPGQITPLILIERAPVCPPQLSSTHKPFMSSASNLNRNSYLPDPHKVTITTKKDEISFIWQQAKIIDLFVIITGFQS
jgi:hypothetical protein